MKPKRIGIPFTGEWVGGSHMSTLLLLQGLDPELFQPVIILHGEGEVAAYLEKRSIPFVFEPLQANDRWNGSGLRRLLSSFEAVLPVRRMIERHNLDLIHVQDHKAFQLWVWATCLARRPLILHWRGPYRKTFVTRMMMRFADRVLVISRYLQEKLPDEIRQRAELIYNPFDTATSHVDRKKLRAALLGELGLPDDSVLLAWIGSLDRRKQPDQFVDVVTALADAGLSRPIHGILCGRDGSISEDPLWRRTINAAADRIHLLGFRDPIVETLVAADALVVTAADEPFGRTVIEAMLCGVPVVAAADGGYVEAVENGKSGFLVPPSDRDGFVEAIRTLLHKPEMVERITLTAARAARERFSIDRHVEAVEAVYRSELGLPEKPSPGTADIAAE